MNALVGSNEDVTDVIYGNRINNKIRKAGIYPCVAIVRGAKDTRLGPGEDVTIGIKGKRMDAKIRNAVIFFCPALSIVSRVKDTPSPSEDFIAGIYGKRLDYRTKLTADLLPEVLGRSGLSPKGQNHARND